MAPAIAATDIAAILDRDLRSLRREVEAYPDERQLWQMLPGLSNCGGTLVLHLAGNLQHYLGAIFAATGYVRDRDAEFARRDVPRAELIAEIERARAAVAAGVSSIDEAALRAEFPELVAQARVRTGDYLVHLCTHFAFHLGQVDLHRRIVTGKAEGIGAVRPVEIASARLTA